MNYDPSSELKRLIEVEKCVQYFLDDTRDDVFGSTEPIEQLYALVLKRTILAGKLAQLRDGVPDWWNPEQSWKDSKDLPRELTD